MRRLSRALSRAGDSKAKEAKEASTISIEKSPSPPPPTYHESAQAADDDLRPSDVTAGFSKLQLGPSSESVPRPQECTAHLKLLECFYRLKQNIAGSEGLFGISSDFVAKLDEIASHALPDGGNKDNEILALLAEKRWQVYVSRAVSRFAEWRNALEPRYDYYTLTRATMSKGQLLADRVKPEKAKPILFDAENLPPVDVLMVWHSYMLNPRAYLEDCAREGRMRLWHTPMPWQAIADAINSESFVYEVSKTGMIMFEEQTHLNWNNLEDSMETSFQCPHCHSTNSIPWTTCGRISKNDEDFQREQVPSYVKDVTYEAVRAQLSTCHGLADSDFNAVCNSCANQVTHDSLRAGKFRSDLEKLLDGDVLMPGNILGKDGLPSRVGTTLDKTGYSLFAFPSKLMNAGLARQILTFNQGSELRMASIRDSIEEGILDRKLVSKARNTHGWTLNRSESLATRRMMSRYWENSSPFALDLVGAVVRQGSFVEKMHNIDWLHSPALPNTMSRLILKYVRFIGIISKHSKMAVPTLDVDLAWHTHQLNPSGYLQYTVAESRTFIDHDDKVAEAKLNDAFAETSKLYQKLYGEPYSECTCWYCEAVRESHTSTASRLFRSNNAMAAEELHDVPSDPKKSVHISAHNAVRPEGDKTYDMAVAQRLHDLERAYNKACQRADKKGKARPKRDDYYYSDAYGYPVYMPAYAPYVGAMAFTPVIYPVNPGCMALGVGAAGNCCAGTCGAAVAAGSCGSGSFGSCAAGMGGAGGVAGCGGGGGGGGCGGGGGGGG
ncbi:hypothetical protein D6C89_09764, partial [Aureobasidium pullulans]